MSIVIGNKSFVGRNVTISNNKIIIDGIDITDQLPDQKKYEIIVTGDVDKIECDVCDKITVNGNVESLSTLSGNVECHDVTNSIQTQSGDVECGNIGGNVTTMSGDVDVQGHINGKVNTMSGDVKHR